MCAAKDSITSLWCWGAVDGTWYMYMGTCWRVSFVMQRKMTNHALEPRQRYMNLTPPLAPPVSPPPPMSERDASAPPLKRYDPATQPVTLANRQQENVAGTTDEEPPLSEGT